MISTVRGVVSGKDVQLPPGSLGAMFGIGPVSAQRSGGNFWYVDGTNGSDSNNGLSPVKAFKTIGKAVSSAKDKAGDTIVVFPGSYAENLTITKYDLAIISAVVLGMGVTTNFRPVIEGGAGVALTLAQCKRFRISGFYLHSTGNTAVLTDGEGCCFENCEIDGDGGAGVVFLCATDPNFNGSGTSFLSCVFDGSVNGILVKPFTAPGGFGNATNVVIAGCQFYGNSAEDIKGVVTNGDNDYCDAWLVTGCFFQDKAKACYIDLSAGSGPSTTIVPAMFAGNFFGATAAMTTTMIKLPTGCVFAGNYNTIGLVDGHTF